MSTQQQATATTQPELITIKPVKQQQQVKLQLMAILITISVAIVYCRLQ